jgi:IS30 family transposase
MSLDSRERGRRRTAAENRGTIPGAVSIRERPPTVEDRAIPGHWEGDLLIGARQGSRIATLVERSTRYVVLVQLASRSAEHVVQRLQRQLPHLPAGALQDANLGPRACNGRASCLHGGHRNPGVLL